MVRAAHGKGAPDLADQFRQEKADVRSLLDEAAQKPAHEQTAHRQKLSELLKAKRSQVGESLKKGTAALGLEAAKISSQVGDGVKAMGALIGGAVHDMGEWKGALGAKLMHFGVGAKQAATAEAPK